MQTYGIKVKNKNILDFKNRWTRMSKTSHEMKKKILRYHSFASPFTNSPFNTHCLHLKCKIYIKCTLHEQSYYIQFRKGSIRQKPQCKT